MRQEAWRVSDGEEVALLDGELLVGRCKTVVRQGVMITRATRYEYYLLTFITISLPGELGEVAGIFL